MQKPTRRSLLALPFAIPLCSQGTDHDQPVELNNPNTEFVFDWECFLPLKSGSAPGSTAQQLLQHTHKLRHRIYVDSTAGLAPILFEYGDRLEFVLEQSNGANLPVQSGAAGGFHIRAQILPFPGLTIPAHAMPAGAHPHLHQAWVFDLDRPLSSVPDASKRPGSLNPVNRRLPIPFPEPNTRIRSINWIHFTAGNRRPQVLPVLLRKGCTRLLFQPNRAKGIMDLNTLQFDPPALTTRPVCKGRA